MKVPIYPKLAIVGKSPKEANEQDIFKRVDKYAEIYKQIADRGAA
ncbi:hypothetical protein [Peribacillus asahii]|nr:hypothetical protein [Peribacillus asahii]